MPGSSPGCLTNRSTAPANARLPASAPNTRGEPGRASAGTRVARLGDEHRQQRHEHRAEQRAVQAAEAAHHDHEQELDRQQHAEDVGGEEADLVGEERAGDAHQARRVGEGHRLVRRRG